MIKCGYCKLEVSSYATGYILQSSNLYLLYPRLKLELQSILRSESEPVAVGM